MHPALGSLVPAWRAGELMWVQGVGYARPNRSHFRSTDIWLSGSDAHVVEGASLAEEIRPLVHGRSKLAAKLGQLQEHIGHLRQAASAAVLLAHIPAAEHGHLARPQLEVTDRHSDDIAEGGVAVTAADLLYIGFAGV